ncbi:MAG: hypothetical protein A2156_08530 [Deltaproteobacteria bacterium RBG_16_48_10]|nr:MAG: hypothetical protein A2156_08530 [Deltaproteobacteria bacterium RBG_16_48_10]
MSNGFIPIAHKDLNAALEEVLFQELTETLSSRQPGHCMKVTDLDLDLMQSICQRLHDAMPECLAYILNNEPSSDKPFSVTSAKVVELRNPLPDGSLRSPLLIFVPDNLRTSSEDSFGVATFEEIHVGHAYEVLKERLLGGLPASLKNSLTEVIQQVSARGWRWADMVAQVRYLLTLKMNGADDEVTGAAIYELGLVPDLKLIENGMVSFGRLIKNLDCLERLTFSQKSERGRVLDLGLKDKQFRSSLAEYLAGIGLENPASWTRRILTEGGKDRRFWFDKWVFEGGDIVPEHVCIEVTKLELPMVSEDETDHKLQALAGQQVLTIGPQGQNKLAVVFRATPAPAQVQGLARFRLQILTKDGLPIGLTKQKATPRTTQQQFRVTFTKLNKVDWEEGWYFIRVTAYTENDDPIPLLDADGQVLPAFNAEKPASAEHRLNQSDLFYVIPGDEIELEPPQRAIPRYPSLTHATIDVRFCALSAGRIPDGIHATQLTWAKDPESRGKKQNDILQAKFGREGLVNIPVSHTLRVLEQRILKSPQDPISWMLRVSDGATGDAVNGLCGWPVTEEVEAFLKERQKYFELLQSQHEGAISASVNFNELRSTIVEYAGSYVNLIQGFLRKAETVEGEHLQGVLQDLQKVLMLDCINLVIVGHRGDRKPAALVSPTHPLRALWIATLSAVAEKWLENAKQTEREYILPTRDALLEGLSLLNFPAVLSMERGHLHVCVDNIHPFWTLYAPPGEEDPRGLVGEVCTSLGLPEPGAGGFLINGQYLADRVRRYLIQHPYVDTLTVNAFNVGRGRILADMLLDLQKRQEIADLKYNIRVFVPDPDSPEVAQDIEELLMPGSQQTAQEADAFCSPTGKHLSPKLSLGLRSIEDFRREPSGYAAHITILFDVFPAQEIGAGRSSPEIEASPVHGLLQDFSVAYSDSGDEIGWHRQPRHGRARSIEGAEELSDLLSRLPTLMSNAAAVVATGLAGLQRLPVVRLVLSQRDRALIHQVHETSDWVFTIDRNMGIEFFDHDGSGDRPEYLIDHSPQLGPSAGRRMIITSRSLTEVEALLDRILTDYQLGVDNDRAGAVLGQLRSLSGRLALKLISSPTNRAEALGLALARMYLNYQGVLRNQIIVPLDAHLDLYRSLRKNVDDLTNEVSLRRTDLALFDLNAANRSITCNLVEVKCYREVGGIGAFNQLVEGIADQLHQSEKILQYHFDPNQLPNDRPDRLVKVQEFVTLLEFYLDRALRFNIISPDIWNEGKYLLRTLENGYQLHFTRSALIFDFEKPGAEVTTEHGDIEFRRIGTNLTRDLVAALPARRKAPKEASVDKVPETQVVVEAEDARIELALAIPKLTKATFISPKRDHSVSWDSLYYTVTPDLDNGAEYQIDSITIPPTKEPPAKPNKEPEKPANNTGAFEVVEPVQIGPSKNLKESEVHPRLESETAKTPPVADQLVPHCDVLLGDTSPSLQYGLIGKVAGRTIGLDLNHPQTISLFGVQGGGKSYTLGTIVEMATMSIPAINVLSNPLATVIFHYSSTQEYAPEFTTMGEPNYDPAALQTLQAEYGGTSQALADIILLAPYDKLEQRRSEYVGLEVRPLKFASSELGASHWRFLMGAVGNQAAYLRQLNRIMRELRNNLSLDGLRRGIHQSTLPDHIKDLANMRLDLAASYIDDSQRLGEILRPGRMIIVDLRDEFIEKDEALGLFVVLLQLFADAKYEGKNFNKLVVFDEAHKYIDSPDLVAGLVEVVREMRHKGTTILVASQDPPSVPVSLMELSTQIIMHRFNSPAWLKHVQKANASLTGLTAEQMARLNPGEAYVWSSKATDSAFSRSTVKIICRPRVTRHGGATRTALG